MNPGTTIEEILVWHFPYGVAGLCAAGGILLVLLFLSYLFTLRKMPFRLKIVPLLLRIAACMILLLCFANPGKTIVRKTEIVPEFKIAMLFDESGSMLKKSANGGTRLHDAVSVWKNKIKPFPGKVEYYAFGAAVRRIKSPDELPDLKSPGAKTNAESTCLDVVFRDGIGMLSAEKFQGAIWFTDGIDTSGARREQLLAMTGGSSIEHIFVPQTAALPSEAELTFRKVEIPSSVQIGTDAQALFLIRCTGLSAGQEGVFELIRNNGQVLKRETLPHGSGIRTVRCAVGADEQGRDALCARLILQGKIRESVKLTVDKIKPGAQANVLIYNGAPDFGTRFIRNVFRENPEMAFDIRYAEGVFPRVRSANNLLPSAAELARYDIVVLMNLRRNNLRPGAAEDLEAFVRAGGGLLFVCGNPLTAREFASSALERLLPVTFDPSPRVDNRDNAEARQILNQAGGSSDIVRFDSQLLKNREFSFRPPPVYRFQLTETGKRSPIFLNRGKNAGDSILHPEYQDSAAVRSVKSGTNVLAVSPSGAPLLAFQNYGAGRSMVLACDPLWRWKMSLPSDNHAYEIFWKNIFSYLASKRNPYTGFAVPDASPGRREWLFVLDSRSADPSAFRCELERNGKKEPVAMRREGGKTGCLLSPEAGDSILRAYDAKGNEAAAITFSAESVSSLPPEMRNLEPDRELLYELANLPNASLWDGRTELDPAEKFGCEKSVIEERTRRPLWHTWQLFALILGLLCAEWIVRRIVRLL